MRLGGWECFVKKGTLPWKAYEKFGGFIDKKTGLTSERHRHRYEFNDSYLNALEKAGLVIAGRSKKEDLVELIQLPTQVHPFFVGTQGHPEYKSTPLHPHPIFMAFMEAVKK